MRPESIEQAEHGAFHVDFHAGVDAVILQGADHFEAGAVAHVGEAGIAMAAEVALQDAAVFGAIEERAPGFEFADAVGRFLGVQFGHAPVVEVLAAAHGVGEVDAPVIAVVDVGERRGDAAFGHHGVGFAEQRLADDADLHAGGGGFDGGAQPRAARADDQHVVGVRLVFGQLEDSPVGPDAHGAEAHVDVGETDGEEARPGPLLVSCR